MHGRLNVKFSIKSYGVGDKTISFTLSITLLVSPLAVDMWKYVMSLILNTDVQSKLLL